MFTKKNLIRDKNSKILTSKSIPMQNRFSWICSLYKIFNIYVLFFEEVTKTFWKLTLINYFENSEWRWGPLAQFRPDRRALIDLLQKDPAHVLLTELNEIQLRAKIRVSEFDYFYENKVEGVWFKIKFYFINFTIKTQQWSWLNFWHLSRWNQMDKSLIRWVIKLESILGWNQSKFNWFKYLLIN